MSLTTNEEAPNRVRRESSQQSKQRIIARDGNRKLHLQIFSAWLHPGLRDLPGIDWTKIPSRLIGYLVNTVGDAWYAPHITLAVGAALGAVGAGSLIRLSSDLNSLFSRIQTSCDSWDGIHITKANLEEYVTKVEQSSRRRRVLLAYSAVTEIHIRDYLEQLDSSFSTQLAPYIPERLSVRFIEQYGGSEIVSADEHRRRKEKSDVLVPIHSILVALIQLRKQAAQRLLFAFRDACQRAETGEALPLYFSYQDELVKVNQDAITVADVRLEKRIVTLKYKLWNRQTWITNHPKEVSKHTRKMAKNRMRAYQSDYEQYFVEFQGQANDLLWIGDLVENGVLMNISQLRKRSRANQLHEKQLQHLAYAQSIGVPNGFYTERPGLLTPTGRFGQWLARNVHRSGAKIFDPESLYRGCLFGAALATLALTNGSRATELLQVSADRFKAHPYVEKRNGQSTGKERVIWLQYLLPKGKKTEAGRQLFPISPQSYELLREIAALLREMHGSIPVIQPHPMNTKAEDLSPERYLFQWATTSDGRIGALAPHDIGVLLRFMLHGLEFRTRQGEPFLVSTHLLRHVMATAARQDHDVPPEVMAFILHHQQSGLVIPIATDYYTEMTEEQRIVVLAEFLGELEEQAANVLLSVPHERTLEQMDEDIREVFERWHVFLETAFGFCGRVGLCPRGYARNLCIGCPHLIPDPRKRANAVNWQASYARQAEELEAAGELVDARQVRLQVQDMDTHINEMDILQQAIDDGTRKPAFLQIAAASSHEVIVDAQT